MTERDDEGEFHVQATTERGQFLQRPGNDKDLFFAPTSGDKAGEVFKLPPGFPVEDFVGDESKLKINSEPNPPAKKFKDDTAQDVPPSKMAKRLHGDRLTLTEARRRLAKTSPRYRSAVLSKLDDLRGDDPNPSTTASAPKASSERRDFDDTQEDTAPTTRAQQFFGQGMTLKQASGELQGTRPRYRAAVMSRLAKLGRGSKQKKRAPAAQKGNKPLTGQTADFETAVGMAGKAVTSLGDSQLMTTEQQSEFRSGGNPDAILPASAMPAQMVGQLGQTLGSDVVGWDLRLLKPDELNLARAMSIKQARQRTQ